MRFVWQTHRCQHYTCQSKAEFLQRSAARDRLCHSFGQFIELVVHIKVSSVVVCSLAALVVAIGAVHRPYKDTIARAAWRSTFRFATATNINVPVAKAISAMPLVTALTACIRFVRQTQRGERYAGDAEAEFLQSPAASQRLRHSFGEFTEFVVHNLSFRLLHRFVLPPSSTGNSAQDYEQG